MESSGGISIIAVLLTREMLHGSIRAMDRMHIHFLTKRAPSRAVAYCDVTGRFAA
jgi:hypothetical protein